VSEFAAYKFNQIACIHAEAYPSAEFRHGPLAMLDEEEKTAVIFLVLDDEDLNQTLSNILQVKERGATVTVITNLEDISKHINQEKIDYLIKVTPHKSILAALMCCTPLLMICYFTALAKGINPDSNLTESINHMETIKD
jgi:glucosamine--fructose-6-phosphate aminotransferase (isomerizing)